MILVYRTVSKHGWYNCFIFIPTRKLFNFYVQYFSLIKYAFTVQITDKSSLNTYCSNNGYFINFSAFLKLNFFSFFFFFFLGQSGLMQTFQKQLSQVLFCWQQLLSSTIVLSSLYPTYLILLLTAVTYELN